MSELNLQLNLFEPITESIEIAEIYGMETGGLLQYFDLKDWRDKTIPTCAGDITVIINALEDYARMLDSVIMEWNLEGYHAVLYELHAARCRKISEKYQKATGYDYNKAIDKCRKRREKQGDDVGEEALSLMAKYGRNGTAKKKSKNNTEVDKESGINFEGEEK